jgi:hypothetical protein
MRYGQRLHLVSYCSRFIEAAMRIAGLVDKQDCGNILIRGGGLLAMGTNEGCDVGGE